MAGARPVRTVYDTDRTVLAFFLDRTVPARKGRFSPGPLKMPRQGHLFFLSADSINTHFHRFPYRPRMNYTPLYNSFSFPTLLIFHSISYIYIPKLYIVNIYFLSIRMKP